MVFTVGRFGLDLAVGGGTYVEQLKDGAAEVSVSGFVAVADLDAVEVLRQQILGYVSLADELFVPVTWDENPHLDGYYKVRAGDVTTSPGLETAGYATFTVTLERVLSFSAPLLELGVMGAVRASENQVITNHFKNPYADGAAAGVADTNTNTLAIVSDSGNNVFTATATSTGAAGYRLSSNADRPAAAEGETWYGVVSLKNPNASSRQLRVIMRFYDQVGATLGSVLSSTDSNVEVVAAGATQLFVVSAVAPSGTASVQLLPFRNSGTGAAVGDLIYADAVYLSKDQPVIDLLAFSSTGVFSGASSDRGGYVFDWTGTTNASTSTATLTLHTDNTFKQCALPESAKSLKTITPANVVSAPILGLMSPVLKFTAPEDQFIADFYQVPADFYDGAATLTLGGKVATGRQVVNDADGWEISNGLIWVRPAASGAAVEISADEVTWREFAFQLGGVGLTTPHSITVMRNSPEFVTLRLLTYLLFGFGGGQNQWVPATIDLTVRRGAKYIAVTVKVAEAWIIGVAGAGFSAAVPFNHGWYLASAGMFIMSPQAINTSTPASVRTASTKTEAFFGIGYCTTPAAVIADTFINREAHAERQYPWAVTERMRVVA